MTTLRGAVVINNQVFCTRTTDKTANVVSFGTVSHALEYNDRDGKFAKTGEFDREPTLQDRYLEGMKIADAMSVEAALEYGARIGRFENRNPEIPMKPGEVSGGCWDINGLADVHQIRDDILGSHSNFVKTVVSVPREWAPELELETKAQWQALIRGNWNRFMDAWGIIPTEHQRWCAFFHTDNAVNIHVHVLSWSDDGKYFCNDQLIPHKAIEPSNDILRRAIFKNISLDKSLVKEYLRESLLTRTRRLIGISITPDNLARLNILAEKAGEKGVEKQEIPSLPKLKELEKSVAQTIPSTGIGRLSFGSANTDTQAKTRDLISYLCEKDDVFNNLLDRWERIGEIGADMMGKGVIGRGEYLARNDADIEKRIGNIILKNIGSSYCQPWMRNTELEKEKKELIKEIVDSIDKDKINQLSYRLLKNPEIQSNAFNAIAWEAIKNNVLINKNISDYLLHVQSFTQSQSGKDLLPEQIARLEARTRNDIARSAGKKLSKEAYSKAMILSYSIADSAALKALYSVRVGKANTNRRYQMEPENIKKLIDYLDNIKVGLRTGSVNNETLKKAVDIIVSTPEMENTLRCAATLTCKLKGIRDDGNKVLRGLIREEREMISNKIIETCEKDISQDRDTTIETIFNLTRQALISSQSLNQSSTSGLKVRARIRRTNELSKDHSRNLERESVSLSL